MDILIRPPRSLTIINSVLMSDTSTARLSGVRSTASRWKSKHPMDYTIVMKFAGPNWLVPLWLATGFWWCNQYNIPEHYMQQFHPDSNPEYTDFIRFEKENIPHQNPERPTLWPWRVTKYEKGGFRVELERNPYYYVVDTLGRQLPILTESRRVWSLNPKFACLKSLQARLTANIVEWNSGTSRSI